MLCATTLLIVDPKDSIIIKAYQELPRTDFKFTNSWNIKSFVRHSNDAMTDKIKKSILESRMTKPWLLTLEQDIINRPGA